MGNLLCLGPDLDNPGHELWRGLNGTVWSLITHKPEWPADLKAALRRHRTAVLVGVCSCGGAASGPMVNHQPHCQAAEISTLLARYGIDLDASPGGR
jgi:hypothetical protein